MPVTVQCLCHAVSMTVENPHQSVGVCHCSTCRKWTGGPMMAVDCESAVAITGNDSLGIFQSSEWAERGFCQKCGTHLFYRIKQTNQYIVPVGLFDTANEFNFDHQIFIDEKPHYYDFANKTHNMTGAEVFAKYTQGE
ncbi:GFA family protein [Aliikangiella maris]|uniref:GFA family protein n=2 Tax=Aliikangiella maris TaxID=3162458 RepID=A0ABV3MJD9_9GAMM